jgi:ResB-like family
MTEEIPTSRTAHFEPLSMFWRFLATPQVLMVLLGLLALTLTLGTLIPQIPPQALADPQAWLAVQPGIFGKSSGLIHALGLFDVYHSLWFHLLLVLTGLALFVRCVDSAELAWHATVGGRWTPAAFASWGRHPPQIRLSTPLSVDDTLARLRDLLSRQGYRWTNVPAQPMECLVAGRWERVLWAQPFLYGALLIALLGLVIVGEWGWQNDDWHPVPGESQAVGHSTPYTVRLEAFAAPQGKDGNLCSYQSEITWQEGEGVVARDMVSIGRPGTLHGIAVRQVGQMPAVKLRGQDDAGRPLVFQLAAEELIPESEVEITFPTVDVQQIVFIPSQELFLSFTLGSPSTKGKPTLYVARLRNGAADRQLIAALSESGSVAVDNLQVNVDVEYRPILRIDYRPAMPLVVGGGALAVLTLAIIWLVPPRLLWSVAEPGEDGSTVVQMFAPPGARGSRWLPQLSDHLQEELADGT